DRAADGGNGYGMDGVRLSNGKTAYDLFGLDEWRVADDLFLVDNSPFLMQPVARVEYPALLKPLGHPGLPSLHIFLHFFGRHVVMQCVVDAIDEQEVGHVLAPFVQEDGGRSAPRGPPFTRMTN